MATLTGLVDRVRMEIGDTGRSFVWTATATATKRYDVPYSPVLGSTLAVFVNGVDKSQQVEVEEHTGVITFDVTPTTGAAISVQGTVYRFFTDAELMTLTDSAVKEHLYNRTDAFGRQLTIANTPPVEEYPISLLATVQALHTLATDASFDINISTPDGVSIPRSERYRQLMDMIRMRKEQYDELCKALNIGLTRIDVYTFRRISRSTNRYVPVYMPQEVEDRTAALRINLPIPTYGGTPVPTTSALYDIVFTQGDSYSAVLDFPFDITPYDPKAQVRLFAESQSLVVEFACAYEDALAGKLRISLTPAQTTKMPIKSIWDLQLVRRSDTTDVKTYMKGSVFVARQVTQGVSSGIVAGP